MNSCSLSQTQSFGEKQTNQRRADENSPNTTPLRVACETTPKFHLWGLKTGTQGGFHLKCSVSKNYDINLGLSLIELVPRFGSKGKPRGGDRGNSFWSGPTLKETDLPILVGLTGSTEAILGFLADFRRIFATGDDSATSH